MKESWCTTINVTTIIAYSEDSWPSNLFAFPDWTFLSDAECIIPVLFFYPDSEGQLEIHIFVWFGKYTLKYTSRTITCEFTNDTFIMQLDFRAATLYRDLWMHRSDFLLAYNRFLFSYDAPTAFAQKQWIYKLNRWYYYWYYGCPNEELSPRFELLCAEINLVRENICTLRRKVVIP